MDQSERSFVGAGSGGAVRLVGDGQVEPAGVSGDGLRLGDPLARLVGRDRHRPHAPRGVRAPSVRDLLRSRRHRAVEFFETQVLAVDLVADARVGAHGDQADLGRLVVLPRFERLLQQRS